ncbi:hypothetical protein [uncultured Thiodictyon sp.]|jgi:hypothetical protein|uniref:hypothetical protein n=1 Tax=uncultured Thiodictyon sp. TaxID=1846217 RepID=UPI0025DD2DB5|nr:hypothetical protein [uncultured Thiodictyon sp.]
MQFRVRENRRHYDNLDNDNDNDNDNRNANELPNTRCQVSLGGRRVYLEIGQQPV